MKKALIGVAVIAMLFVTLGSVAANGMNQDQNTANQEARANELIQKFKQAVAQGKGVGEIAEIARGIYPGGYRDVYVDVYKGVALDRYTLTTEPAILLRISYNNADQIYFLLGDELYKMKFIDLKGEGNNWIIRLKADNGEELLIFAHESNYMATVTGIFGDYLINFEPVYFARHTRSVPEPVPPRPIPPRPFPEPPYVDEGKGVPIPLFSGIGSAEEVVPAQEASTGPRFWR